MSVVHRVALPRPHTYPEVEHTHASPDRPQKSTFPELINFKHRVRRHTETELFARMTCTEASTPSPPRPRPRGQQRVQPPRALLPGPPSWSRTFSVRGVASETDRVTSADRAEVRSRSMFRVPSLEFLRSSLDSSSSLPPFRWRRSSSMISASQLHSQPRGAPLHPSPLALARARGGVASWFSSPGPIAKFPKVDLSQAESSLVFANSPQTSPQSRTHAVEEAPSHRPREGPSKT
ncbi:hypothetical protein T484DRAFT_2697219 [Baffinella frigidus]|nr:hypothetical protein T484DRAFT_2697219 [Cryptophyta sp. CCMP2293]